MTSNDGYNGWANYPTWNIALWINDDPGLQELVLERAAEMFSESRFNLVYPGQSRKKAAARELGEWLKEYYDEEKPDLTGPLADILGWALSCVNWYELGERFISDHIENLRYEHGGA